MQPEASLPAGAAQEPQGQQAGEQRASTPDEPRPAIPIAPTAASDPATMPAAGSGADAAGSGADAAGSGADAAGSGADAPGASSDPSKADTADAPGSAPDVSPGAFDHAMETVELTETLTIAPGETLRIGPGTTFRAATGVSIVIQGALVVEGTPDAPVQFEGAGAPRSWEGIVITDGGRFEAEHVEIGGATYGVHAQPGSDFTIDYADIGTSFKAAVVQSDGSFNHTAFHASGDPTFSLSSTEAMTNPNGTLTIIDGSPHIENSSFDSGAPLVDMVRVRGNSTASFDHLYITDAHCGIHMEDGVNTSPTVRNSVFEGLAYGVMAYATKPTLSDNVFMNNATDVGVCLGATADNTPKLSNNYYSSGNPLVDPSCAQIGTADTAPGSVASPSAGPDGL